MSPKAGIIGVIRNPGEYKVLRRLRGRKKPLGRIPQGFARDLLKKYRRTTGLARGSLFYLALFGRAGQLTRNIYRSYHFSIAINNRIFLSISRTDRPGLLRSGEKYPVDYVAYPPHVQVYRIFTLDKHRSFTAYASLRMPELGMQGPVARAPSASLAGPISTAIFPVSVSNLALYPAFRMDFLNSLHRHEAATRFPVLYAAKTSGIIGSHNNWMRNGTSLRETTHERRSVSSRRSLTTHEIVYIPNSSSETQQHFISGARVPTVPFRVQAGLLAIDAAGIGTPVLGVRSGRIRADVVEKLRYTPALESRPVSFGRPSGKAVSGSFPYHGLGRSWPSVSSGVKEFQHDTTEYTTTVVRPVMRFASSISSIRSMLSGRSTQLLRPVSYKSPASRETIHVLGLSSEIQQQFRPSRAGVHTVPFRVQAGRVVVAAARIGTPVLGVRPGRIRTDVVEKLRYTPAPESRPVSFGRPSGKAVSGSFPYHGLGRSWPSVSSGVKEFQHDTTEYTTTVVRPVMRFASSISSIRSMLSGKSTQVLRPVGHRSPAFLETVHILNSSSETQQQFRPSGTRIHTVPFRVQAGRVAVATSRIGTSFLDVHPGRIRSNRLHSLAVGRLLQGFNRGQIAPKWVFTPDYALKPEKRLPTVKWEVNNDIRTDVVGESRDAFDPDSGPVSFGGPSSKAVSGSFPYHGPGSSVPVVSVLEGPHKVLAESGKPLVRPVMSQEKISSTAQLPLDAQPYKQTKDVIPKGDNTFAAHWTEILHKPRTNMTSQRIMRNIELINNLYVHRVMGQKPGGDGRHTEFFPLKGHGFPWMPASRSRDRGLEMTHVPMRLPVASSGMEGHTKEGAGTAPVQGSLQVKGPEMSGTLPVPEVDAHSLANRVYGLIVERVKRELELRGR